MNLEESCKRKKNLVTILAYVALVCCITGCKKESVEFKDSIRTNLDQEESNEVIELKLFFDNTEIPVIWEHNDTVDELFEETAKGNIIVDMSRYGENEQMGFLGRDYSKNDSQMTTHIGDMVLYNGNQIVVFYGSNTWAYTKIGKIDLSKEEIIELLSLENIKLTIKR